MCMYSIKVRSFINLKKKNSSSATKLTSWPNMTSVSYIGFIFVHKEILSIFNHF